MNSKLQKFFKGLFMEIESEKTDKEIATEVKEIKMKADLATEDLIDDETEEAVMKAISELSQDLTILIIAHRLTTLKNCTQIVELGNCVIKRVGTYSDLIGLPA